MPGTFGTARRGPRLRASPSPSPSHHELPLRGYSRRPLDLERLNPGPDRPHPVDRDLQKRMLALPGVSLPQAAAPPVEGLVAPDLEHEDSSLGNLVRRAGVCRYIALKFKRQVQVSLDHLAITAGHGNSPLLGWFRVANQFCFRSRSAPARSDGNAAAWYQSRREAGKPSRSPASLVSRGTPVTVAAAPEPW